MHIHIIPYADILAWCLMPNHFHIMVNIRKTEIRSIEKTRGNTKVIMRFNESQLSESEMKQKYFSKTFNQSIGKMLGSYTRAVNLTQGFSGSLFRKSTKAVCLNNNFETMNTCVSALDMTIITRDIPENQYTFTVFNYIHQNPVSAGLVKHPEDWEFSSFRDIYCNRNGILINKKLIESLRLNDLNL